MVLGASGGIGHLAVQLAQRWGVRVLAVASGEDGAGLVRRLGADAAVDGRTADVAAAARRFAPDGLDAALIIVGGAAGAVALAALHDAGRAAIPNGVEPVPTGRGGLRPIFYDGDRSQHGTNRLNTAIDAGPFEVHLAQTFARQEAAEAHGALSAHYLGKLALIDESVT